jgi:hypothetical protein
MILLEPNIHISDRIFLEEQLKLSPIVISPSLILTVLKCMHGYLARFISRDDLCDKIAIAHIFAIVLDGVGEVEALHPFEDLPG